MPWSDLAGLWERGLEDSGDPDLPFAVALGIAPEHHGSPLTMYASAAPTIGDVVEAFVAFWPTITDAFAWSWHADGTGGRLIGDRAGADRGECALLAFVGAEAVGAGRMATAGRWRPRELRLPWVSDGRHDAALGVSPQPSVNAVHIGLRRSDLQVAPRYADPSLSRILYGQLAVEAEVRGATVRERVRREFLLVFDGPSGPRAVPDLPAVAKRIGRSPRSVHRDLAAAGTSFRHVLAEVRWEVARDWLPRAPIPDVSERLGYGEPRAFYRAFRRWAGMSPSEWLRSRSPGR